MLKGSSWLWWKLVMLTEGTCLGRFKMLLPRSELMFLKHIFFYLICFICIIYICTIYSKFPSLAYCSHLKKNPKMYHSWMRLKVLFNSAQWMEDIKKRENKDESLSLITHNRLLLLKYKIHNLNHETQHLHQGTFTGNSTRSNYLHF